MVRVREANQTAAEQGKAKLRILDFKTVWSEFQKPTQTAAERGEAKLRILDFKTTWSEFQKPRQTLAEQGQHLTVKTSAKSSPITSQNSIKVRLQGRPFSGLVAS